ncbi:MAG: hypothetical protein HKN21_03655 [Candidatus Eisenbacteria bacterium]|uniref:N(G),N(G)-dimethylarginine dimethylaminohydrolase n=1 Tax=Eiseniibacteriota bacterium TaxID=2212470 RepID=A0A7Y2E632_UNCEI|nr:hypothetical protein [Candidatus Eisenbacteria bacterium]
MRTGRKTTRAIVRTPGPNAEIGLTTASLGKPDFDKLLEQHKAYVEALQGLGVQVTELPHLPEFPDAYFVEDVAVLYQDTVIITRPGAESRRHEIDHILGALVESPEILTIDAPGTVDGGDVLIHEDTAYVGLSERTNLPGGHQLKEILRDHGLLVQMVPVGEGLHLKSSVNSVPGALLIAPDFLDHPAFLGKSKIPVHPDEVYAANAVTISDTVLFPAGFPKTARKLESLGIALQFMETSEIQKMDGGLTCLSLRFFD